MNKDIIHQLWDIYQQEYWHTKRLPFEQFEYYTKRMIDKGNLFYGLDGEKVIGYCEFWRINFEQFGRLMCGIDLPCEEDLQHGNIAYVANVWIEKGLRSTKIIENMLDVFYTINKDCEYVVGRRLKNGEPIRVHKMLREQIGAIDGKQ